MMQEPISDFIKKDTYNKIKRLHHQFEAELGQYPCIPSPLSQRLCVPVPSQNLLIYISNQFSLIHFNTSTHSVVGDYTFPDSIATKTFYNLCIDESDTRLFLIMSASQNKFYSTNLDLTGLKTHSLAAIIKQISPIHKTKSLTHAWKFSRYSLELKNIYLAIRQTISTREDTYSTRTFVVTLNLSTSAFKIIYQTIKSKRQGLFWIDKSSFCSEKKYEFGLRLEHPYKTWQYIDIKKKKMLYTMECKGVTRVDEGTRAFLNDLENFRIMYSDKQFLVFDVRRVIHVFNKEKKKIESFPMKSYSKDSGIGHILSVCPLGSSFDPSELCSRDHIQFTPLPSTKNKLWILWSYGRLNSYFAKYDKYNNFQKDVHFFFHTNKFLTDKEKTVPTLYTLLVNPFKPSETDRILSYERFHNSKFNVIMPRFETYSLYYTALHPSEQVSKFSPDKIITRSERTDRKNRMTNTATFVFTLKNEPETKAPGYPYSISKEGLRKYYTVSFDQNTGERSEYASFWSYNMRELRKSPVKGDLNSRLLICSSSPVMAFEYDWEQVDKGFLLLVDIPKRDKSLNKDFIPVIPLKLKDLLMCRIPVQSYIDYFSGDMIVMNLYKKVGDNSMDKYVLKAEFPPNLMEIVETGEDLDQFFREYGVGHFLFPPFKSNSPNLVQFYTLKSDEGVKVLCNCPILKTELIMNVSDYLTEAEKNKPNLRISCSLNQKNRDYSKSHIRPIWWKKKYENQVSIGPKAQNEFIFYFRTGTNQKKMKWTICKNEGINSISLIESVKLRKKGGISGSFSLENGENYQPTMTIGRRDCYNEFNSLKRQKPGCFYYPSLKMFNTSTMKLDKVEFESPNMPPLPSRDNITTGEAVMYLLKLMDMFAMNPRFFESKEFRNVLLAVSQYSMIAKYLYLVDPFIFGKRVNQMNNCLNEVSLSTIAGQKKLIELFEEVNKNQDEETIKSY